MMVAFLTRSALDLRFVDLVLFMCLGVWPWLGQGFFMPGLWSFPASGLLVTVGVLIFYRAGTGTDQIGSRRESQA